MAEHIQGSKWNWCKTGKTLSRLLKLLCHNHIPGKHAYTHEASQTKQEKNASNDINMCSLQGVSMMKLTTLIGKWMRRISSKQRNTQSEMETQHALQCKPNKRSQHACMATDGKLMRNRRAKNHSDKQRHRKGARPLVVYKETDGKKQNAVSITIRQTAKSFSWIQ